MASTLLDAVRKAETAPASAARAHGYLCMSCIPLLCLACMFDKSFRELPVYSFRNRAELPVGGPDYDLHVIFVLDSPIVSHQSYLDWTMSGRALRTAVMEARIPSSWLTRRNCPNPWYYSALSSSPSVYQPLSNLGTISLLSRFSSNEAMLVIVCIVPGHLKICSNAPRTLWILEIVVVFQALHLRRLRRVEAISSFFFPQCWLSYSILACSRHRALTYPYTLVHLSQHYYSLQHYLHIFSILYAWVHYGTRTNPYGGPDPELCF